MGLLPSDAEEVRCSECGDPLVDPADIADGMHFLCDPTMVDYDDDDERERPFDEGGENG